MVQWGWIKYVIRLIVDDIGFNCLNILKAGEWKSHTLILQMTLQVIDCLHSMNKMIQSIHKSYGYECLHKGIW